MQCPVSDLTKLVGSKWTIVLLQEIELNGLDGFNAILKRMKDISPKVLSQRIAALEEYKLIVRSLDDNSPPKSSYSLTEKGIQLQKIILDLKTFNMNFSNRVLPCLNIDCVDCELYSKKPISRHQL